MANNTPDYRASYTDSFAHAFDAKGRITVPAEWRVEPFENRLFILPSSESCLRVYPASWFGRLQERVADMKSPQHRAEEGRDARRAARSFSNLGQGQVGRPADGARHRGGGAARHGPMTFLTDFWRTQPAEAGGVRKMTRR
jgi:hypothetical protein